MVTQKINLNDCIWAEVTDYGWACIFEHYEELFGNVEDALKGVQLYRDKTQKKVVEGKERNLTEFQIHSFMNLFGKKAYNGGKNFVTDCSIYILKE